MPKKTIFSLHRLEKVNVTGLYGCKDVCCSYKRCFLSKCKNMGFSNNAQNYTRAVKIKQ